MKTKGNWKRLEVVISIRHSKNRDDDDEGGDFGQVRWWKMGLFIFMVRGQPCKCHIILMSRRWMSVIEWDDSREKGHPPHV